MLTFALLLPIVVMLAIEAAPSRGAESLGAAMPDDPLELTGLVKARKGALTVDGAPWQAVGFNDYRLTSAPGGYACDGEVGMEELGRRLDRAAAAGATVVRTWFFQSMWDPDGDGRGTFGPLDRVVAAASARGIRVVPVLGNHWQDCLNGGEGKDIDFYAGGFRSPQGPFALSYLDYVQTVAAHYAGAPGIAYWQLINEPEAPAADGSCDEQAAADAMAGFAGEAGAAIREVDPTHALSLGTIGGGQCGTAGADYARVSGPVDVCEIHVYDGEETGSSPATPMPGDTANGVATRISQCTAAGKPIVAGELGFEADLDEAGQPTGTVTAETLANRAGFLQARVDAMTAAGLDGYMVWQMQADAPEAGDDDPYGVGPCDPIDSVMRAAGAATTELAAADGCDEG